MKLVVGQTIPCTLQLKDRATGKFPRAIVRDNSGSTLSVLNLTHVSSGLYQDHSTTMTNVPSVTVQYIVYSDSGHTTIDTAYETVLETFERDELIDTPEVESTISIKETLRLVLAALAGKISGANTHTVTIRNVGDSKDRITATVDDYGNRTAITYDVSD